MSTQTLAFYSQYRTFNHIYLFKTKSDQSLTLKIFDQAQKKLATIPAPSSQLSKWSKIENARMLLKLFILNNLIPRDFLPFTSIVNPTHEFQQLIFLAKAYEKTKNIKQFICPMTLEVFKDPFTDEHGHSFERSPIIEYVKQYSSCPISQHPVHFLMPNRSLRETIHELKKQDLIPTLTLFEKPNPDLFSKNLETALSCIEQEKYEEALESYSKAFKYTNDWRHYVELPKFFEKISHFEKATLAYLYLALYQLQDKKLTEAIQTLEQCKKITPLSQQIDKLLIHLYSVNQQADHAIKLALQSVQTITQVNQALHLYKQILIIDPCQWDVYQPLSRLLTTPEAKAHILLKGAWHALESEKYVIALELAKKANKIYEDSLIDRLFDLECYKDAPDHLKRKLLTLAQFYEQKNLIPSMVKLYKRLARLNYNSTYYQKIITYTSENNKIHWTLTWLSEAIDNKDWPSAEYAATTTLKLTNDPIPILCQLETVYTHWHNNQLNHILHRLGIEYLLTSQIDLAEKTYRKAYERLQSQENALSLGEILQKQNKIQESVQLYYEASNLALRTNNLENLQLSLRKICDIDPTLIHLTQDQKALVLNHLKFSININQIQDKLEQTESKTFIESQFSHTKQSTSGSKTRVYKLNS